MNGILRCPKCIEAGRRDFLAWLLAVPTVACSLKTASDPSDAGGSDASSAVPSGGGEIDATPPYDAGVDVALTDAEHEQCLMTTRDAEGPYFTAGSPQRNVYIASLEEPGVRLLVEGRIYGPDCRTPLEGYAIDLWQADQNGNYFDAAVGEPYRLRGKVVTDADGGYRFETILPGRYGDSAGIRPAHLHAKFLTPGGNALLTTQIYFAGDPYLGDADYCTRSGTCNSSDARRALALADAIVSGKAGKRASFNVFLPQT